MQIAGTLSLHVSPRSLLTGPEYTAFRVSEDLFNLFSEKIQCNIHFSHKNASAFFWLEFCGDTKV